MSRVVYSHRYENIISPDNLLAAWREFLKGKRGKHDVREFRYRLSDNILTLHRDLKNKIYKHGGYHHFRISDPKPRDIHKASVRDRLLHHAVYRILYPYFDQRFIHDSYSCRVGKGTHRAFRQLCAYAQSCGCNHTRTCWVLKCDVKKFFASIDHGVLFTVLERSIQDQNILWLLKEVVGSFSSSNIQTFCKMTECSKGLPLGNLTSQLLVNIYLNEFDQFVKHTLKAKYYIRCADDFVLLSHDKKELEQSLRYIVGFLRERLKLELHPDKVSIKTFASGIDFLGWVHFPDHRVLRTSTKRRMFRRTVGVEKKDPMVQSYLGLLSHGNTEKLKTRLLRI